MEEIAKIISAISEVTGLDEGSVKSGKTDECKQSRDILCYIALKDMYGLTWSLMDLLNYRKSQVFFSADRCKERLEDDISFLKIMNGVRKKLLLAPIYTDKIDEIKEKERQRKQEEDITRSKENSKRIFGIEYTPTDEHNISIATNNAMAYMKGYCQIGRQTNQILRD